MNALKIPCVRRSVTESGHDCKTLVSLEYQVNTLETDIKRSQGLGRYTVDCSEKNRRYLGGRSLEGYQIADGQFLVEKCCLN